MTQFPPRLEARRRKRRTSKAAVAGVLVAAVVLVAAGAWLGWRTLAHARTSSPTAVPLTAQPTAAAAASASHSTSSPSTASAGSIASSSTSQTQAPHTGGESSSASAVAKAAVPFPGAPSLSPTKPSISQLHPRHKYIALTLDDGYNFQPAMLELLKQYNVHSTTFLIGSWAATHKADLKLMKDAGFEIANHSWSHPFLTKMSSSQVASELKRTQRVITSVTGNQAPYLRPPFGDTDSAVKASAAKLGYRIVLWNRSFGDSGRGATPKKLYANVMTSNGGVQPGDVILCHWGSKGSYQALKKILPELTAQGYQFVTVSELIADSKSSK